MNETQSFLQKAETYDLLSSYYQYSNPELHEYYSHKHLYNLEKAAQLLNQEQMKVNLPAQVRILHAASACSPIDIHVDGTCFFNKLSCKDSSDYISLPAGTYQLDIYLSEEARSPLLSRKMSFEGGTSYTLAVAFTKESFTLSPFIDLPFVPRHEAKFRFIHMSVSMPSVDIAVKDGDIVFERVAFQQASDYLTIHPMLIDLVAREAGTKQVVSSSLNVEFKENTASTLYILGLNNETKHLETIKLSP
ncbi:DUF4397 domain-containing protein [Peribacillus sp. SI8-4]|uniref:DUF4397 domain-containing protein n=1 Tax=Peribacillus sp. SI8-4 TaxID=3048009 RepID=UPI002553DBD9|nr:DUF4397 domain-containing protein [Peribacillus sp. SI8-4]